MNGNLADLFQSDWARTLQSELSALERQKKLKEGRRQKMSRIPEKRHSPPVNWEEVEELPIAQKEEREVPDRWEELCGKPAKTVPKVRKPPAIQKWFGIPQSESESSESENEWSEVERRGRT